MLAIDKGNKNKLELLIRNGANVNGFTDNEITPLLFAIQSKHENKDLVRFIIKEGANPNIPNKSNPLDTASGKPL
jgi:ankyrin repeat protein